MITAKESRKDGNSKLRVNEHVGVDYLLHGNLVFETDLPSTRREVVRNSSPRCCLGFRK